MLFRVLTILFIITFAQVAHAQWSWRHPRPQGHTLNDVVFLDETTVIAVGEWGTVLVSHDAGASWVVKPMASGGTLALLAIDRLDDHTAVAVGENGVILRTTDQGATWTQIPGVSASSLLDVSFVDATHGIAVAGPAMLRTSDGGNSWQVAPVAQTMRAVDMITANDAVAVGDFASVMVTTDGGASWAPGASPAPASTGVSFTAVDFLDAMHGAIGSAVGTDPYGAITPSYCYATDDGGTTWIGTHLDFGLTFREFTPREILLAAPGEIIVAGRVACCTTSAFDPWPVGDFVRTTNSGTLWTHQAINRPAHGLARNAGGTTIIVGEDGRMTHRSPGGVFTSIGGPGQPHMIFDESASSFADALTGVVFSSDGLNPMLGTGNTYFSRTADGGQTWTSSYFGTTMCMDVTHLSPTEVLAVGLEQGGTMGSVLRSMDGGGTWSQLWLGTAPPALVAVTTGSSTRAIAVGTGTMALIIDNGAVTPVATGGTDFKDVAFAGTGVIVAVGATDARSTDGGSTWAPIPGPPTDIHALDFVSATTGFGIAPTGILRTNDAGTTWVPAHAQAGLRDIDFSNADHGMAVGDNGMVIVTSDGGNTWVTMESPTPRKLMDVTMIGPAHAFASGSQQVVFEYGDQPVPTTIRALDARPLPFAAELRWTLGDASDPAGFTVRRHDGTAETVAGELDPRARSFLDEGLAPGRTYEYRLLAVDRDGSITQSAPVRVTIPVASVELLPSQPNPFNPSTLIRFVLPERARARVGIYDVAGRHVVTLLDETRDAGLHSVTWDGTNARGEGVASGVYMSRLEVGKARAARKLVLMK